MTALNLSKVSYFYCNSLPVFFILSLAFLIIFNVKTYLTNLGTIGD